ncbi:hypothetical protein CAEBREN_05330 [Caenorhabditis brenneri]|uniref:Uncharacterized protein n=1 Tax=Caenorhabditis brenneri TaxID=135651 RepID=G0N784_CAEBE|nr:hypothetical protein CAEBREN_05330 [Caenorhabditis brenneri]
MWIPLLILCFWTMGISTLAPPREPDYSRIAGDPKTSYFCTNNFTLVFAKCLRHFPEPTTRMTAMKTCRRYSGNLVTIKTRDEQASVKHHLGAEPRKYWIGLYCFTDNVSQCVWDNGNATAQALRHFPPFSPSVKLGNCVHSQINGDGKEVWLSTNCEEEKLEFYCEIPVTLEDHCELNFNQHCYFPSVLAEKGIQNARNSCKQPFGADLVSIGSREEHLFIKNYYKTLNVSSIFIGARAWLGRYFKWMDGTSWTYTASDRYNIILGDCMVMNLKSDGNRTEGYWYGEDCMATRHFMCKRKAGQRFLIQKPLYKPPRWSLRLVSSYMNYGTITSPDYPEGYGPNVTAVYKLWTLGSQRIQLHFLEIQTEKDHDFVRVYDGMSEESKLIGNLSGQHRDLFLESSSNRMHVVFKTDLQGNDLGFQANFKSIV